MSIKIDLKIFLFGIIFVMTKQIETYTILMIFAFIHELAHLIAGVILGYKLESIGINPFGFHIVFNQLIEDYNKKVRKANKTNMKKIIIALAGPAINFIISFMCLNINNQYYILKEQIIYSNILLGMFNLLPIYPLDGGRILKESICIIKGKRKAYQVLSKVSKITIIILTIIVSIAILYIHNIALILILGYLWYIVIKNEKIYKLKEKIYSICY